MLYSFAIYFIIYGFIGWIVDTIFHTIHSKKLKKGGTFFYGPISTIYAFPLTIIALIIDNFNVNKFLLIIILAVLLTIWEYVIAVFMENTFKKKFWDYSGRKFNFQGRICLEMSIVWAIGMALFVLRLHPFTISMIAKIPGNILYYALIIFYIIFFVDLALSIRKNYFLKEK